MANLYPYLILIGVSVILATSWLLYQARRRALITNELVALNEKLAFDLPDFLRNCWEPLAKAGFRGLSWHLDWYGSELTDSRGEEGELFISRQLKIEDIALTIKLYDARRRFEQRYFSAMVSESLFLLLYMDMWVKLATVQGAFAQSARMNVFLQHDMKNIVQLINLLAEQLEASDGSDEAKLMESFRTVMPLLQGRCERFLATLSGRTGEERQDLVSLPEALHKTADIHELKVQISGQGEVAISEQTLHSVFDNLFGNYNDASVRQPGLESDIAISIADGEPDFIEVRLSDRNGKPCLWPERLFEPFWSAKADGLGIGLYHARQLLTAAGARIEVVAAVDKPLIFVIYLPKKCKKNLHVAPVMGCAYSVATS